MFSDALRKLDENTMNFMIVDMKNEIDGLKKELADRNQELSDKERILHEQEQEIFELKKLLEGKKSYLQYDKV